MLLKVLLLPFILGLIMLIWFPVTAALPNRASYIPCKVLYEHRGAGGMSCSCHAAMVALGSTTF